MLTWRRLGLASNLESIRHSLPTKVTSLVVGILIAGFGGLLIVNIRREANSRIEKYEDTARLLATSITTSIQNGMLESRPDIIIRTVTDMKVKLKEVRRVDLFRRNGVLAFTDLETVNAVNKFTGLEPELIKKITKLRVPPGPRNDDADFLLAVNSEKPVQSYQSSDEGRMLTLYQPLKNLKECQECHNKDHHIRGVLRISLGLSQLDAELREARNWQLIIAFFTILGVTATIIKFMGRVVLKPIGKVAQAAKRIGEGDLDARVPVSTRDEIGQLSTAINKMAGHLKKTHGELESEIVERKHAEEEVKLNLERIKTQALELEKANKVKSEFLSVMSHELRTPLNVILGYMWLLRAKESGEINSEQATTLEKVEKQSRLLLTMVNSILETTRIEADVATIEVGDVSWNRLFESLKSNCEALVDKNISVRWNYPDDLPVIRTDGAKLERILQNIIENAVKFTDEGSVDISAQMCSETNSFEIKVSDTGIGIPENALATIFDMFHQSDSSSSRDYGGVGLGLYVARKYANLLGASIEVESVVGKGSIFTVRLPYNQAFRDNSETLGSKVTSAFQDTKHALDSEER
jgi:signal transduction histidine kinase